MKINFKTKTVTGISLAVCVLSSLAWTNKHENPILIKDGYTFTDFNKNGILDKYEDYRLPLETRVQDLLSQLTDEEKASLLTGTGMPGFNPVNFSFDPEAPQGKVPGAAGSTFPIERLGLAAIVVADGPAGLRINPTRKDDSKKYYCTAFPVGTALASTWNEELITQVGKAIGNEVKEYGVDVLLGPGMNIHRNPLCGRNFEYYSEDPLITGKIGAAMVNGVQAYGVGTSVKHFAVNNQETNRMGINAHVSERALREIYFKGFEITVKEARPWTVMSSYNKINGTYASENQELLTKLLRDEWGFDGIVMTDWFGGYNGFMSPFAPNAVSNVEAQMNAGNDLLMPGMPSQQAALLEKIKSGAISAEVINKNVSRILALALKSSSMNKYAYTNNPNLVDNAAVTRAAAAEGMVLLQNKQNVLPLDVNVKKPIALFGVTSYDIISGGTGSGDVNEAYTVSLIDAFVNAGFLIDKKLVNSYVPYTAKVKAAEMKRRQKDGLLATPKRLPELVLSKETIAAKAKINNMAIITIGRNAGEAADRSIADFNLAADEIALINNVSEAFHKLKKKVIVVLNVGGVIETASWRSKVDGILLAWQPGQEGGNSVVDVLSGKVNPSGKLTMTFPMKYSDTPSAKNWLGVPANLPTSVKYEEGVYVGYRYFNTFNVKPAYEFGYGLSYTNFSYENVSIENNIANDEIKVHLTVRNTGKAIGKDVVELYVAAPAKSTDKPKSELRAFAKTRALGPQEKQELTLTLHAADLASFDAKIHAWITEPGKYQVLLGNSSTNILQTLDFELNQEYLISKGQANFPTDIQLIELKK
ncbi:MAG: hypothetical protein RL699_1130 [Bacteroidota bacterium]|jgi:beta-glucosidase